MATVSVRFLVPAGGHEFRASFAKAAVVAAVKEQLVKDAPEQLERRPGSAAEITLIHRGRFLSNDAQLDKEGVDDTTTLHMLVRDPELVGEGASSGKDGKDGGAESQGSRGCCVVL